MGGARFTMQGRYIEQSLSKYQEQQGTYLPVL